MCTQLLFCVLKNISHNVQAVFSKKRFQTPLKPFSSGYKLEDYIIGNQIGKGSNAAVYEAAASFASTKESKNAQVQLREDEEEGETARSLTCCSLKTFPLAIKMMWNFGVGLQQYSTLFPTSLGISPARKNRPTSALMGIF